MKKEGHSWRRLEDGSLIKFIDKSCFDSDGSAIPREFHVAFGIQEESDKEILISCEGIVESIALKWTRKGQTSPIVRMFWRGTKFSSLLRENFPSWPSLRPHVKQIDQGIVFYSTNQNNTFEIGFFRKREELTGTNRFELQVGDLLQGPLTKPNGTKIPKRKKQSSNAIERDAAVCAWIIENSKGLCECCKKPAPFTKNNGLPGLEVHHVRQLSKGGSDTPQNAVAVCPNCHRELHLGVDSRNLTRRLYRTINRLIEE